MWTRWKQVSVICLALLLLASVVFAARSGVETRIVMSGVTTNTTTGAVAIPMGYKTIYGQVVGTGVVTQTQALFGDIDDDAANGILLCTLTLSGTTRTQDACPPFTANFPFHYVTTTNTTGTGATGAMYAGY